ncbi:MAG: Rieske 2Fe-2S domain-containing protein [Immundisolibacteraceae bacterium]|nr:Rieske 2Fe-2S domain-containing protein [Immundisolibacteraceae bacterium]
MNAPTPPADLNTCQVDWPDGLNSVPSSIFSREDVYQLELDKIFYGPLWHPVAHESEIAEPGDFKTFQIGEVPIIINRDMDGKFHTFLNVSTHRGTLVETKNSGTRRNFNCPYHGWGWNSAGDLTACPNSEDFPASFKKENYSLKQLRCESFEGLLFATFSDDTPPLHEWLSGVAGPLKYALGDGEPLQFLGYQKTTYASNWKTYRDNDGYHVAQLHAAFRLLNWQGGQGEQVVDAQGNMSVVAELNVAAAGNFLKDPSVVEFRGSDPSRGANIIVTNPVTLTTRHMDMFNIRFVIPRGVDKTEVHWAYYAKQSDDAEMVRHRVMQSSNVLGPSGLVSLEDAAAFSRIQATAKVDGVSRFMKGIGDENALSDKASQNDETANMIWWNDYRERMGFAHPAPRKF